MDLQFDLKEKEERLLRDGKLILEKLEKGGLSDQRFTSFIETYMNIGLSITNKIIALDNAKKKEEIKKEPLIRYVDEVILTKLMNNFIHIKDIHSAVFIKDEKLHIDFIYTGPTKMKSLIDVTERLKLINWEIFSGQINFKPIDNINDGIVASFVTTKENDLFKSWAKEQLLNIIKHKYPNDEIEIRFLFED